MEEPSPEERPPIPQKLIDAAGKKPKMLRKIRRSKYCQIITIRDGKGDHMRRTEIPASARDNRIANIIAVSKLRKLAEDQIDNYSDQMVVVSPKELLELSQTLNNISEASYRAHGDVISKEKIPELPPVPTQNNQTNIGALFIGSNQTAKSFDDALNAVGNVGKKPAAIELTPEPPPTQ